MGGNAISLLGALLTLSRVAKGDPPFNNPPGVDVWCGKAYRETVWMEDSLGSSLANRV